MNYLEEKRESACSIYFEHPLSGSNYPGTYINLLHYMSCTSGIIIRDWLFQDFPFVFHTVGSAIAVKAFVYVKAGGMNRSRQEKIFILSRNWYRQVVTSV